ncbi:MAG: hypothetical protein AAF747_08275 [Planctomycetota bacterium]
MQLAVFTLHHLRSPRTPSSMHRPNRVSELALRGITPVVAITADSLPTTTLAEIAQEQRPETSRGVWSLRRDVEGSL